MSVPGIQCNSLIHQDTMLTELEQEWIVDKATSQQ